MAMNGIQRQQEWGTRRELESLYDQMTISNLFWRYLELYKQGYLRFQTRTNGLFLKNKKGGGIVERCVHLSQSHELNHLK